ncbi:proteasome assembly chaperone family protein [Actinotalea sp. Marseille-Q4924]|uniref:proteasome assembly chaperone family protein n=1 Tax=Actinotalea sp. Marseille-Q4924 TaxID=2866571 RepID=UPI001CE4902A|nr:PAC2 family protein [Actinotalea sp. Marseille-Q4924]
MNESQDLYTVDEDVARELIARTAAGAPGPVLVHMVRGFVDAGAAGQGAAEHLTERFGAQRLVTFDADQLVDYRSRRPTMTFSSTHWSDYDEPTLAVDVVRDGEDVPFLLLHGVEPDVQWERFAGAVRDVVERFAVPLTVGVHGIPMGVPHTRPLGITAHATRPELVAEHTSWFGTVQVPASVSALLEYRLGTWGHDAMGFAVHVPHYLAQSACPRASQVALEHVERSTGLELDTPGLEEAARDAVVEVDRQVAASEDVSAVVRALEEQYDSFARAIGRTSLLAESADLPTADELGEQFERFLAQQGGDGPRL